MPAGPAGHQQIAEYIRDSSRTGAPEHREALRAGTRAACGWHRHIAAEGAEATDRVRAHVNALTAPQFAELLGRMVAAQVHDNDRAADFFHQLDVELDAPAGQQPATASPAKKKPKRPRKIHASVPFVPATTDPVQMVKDADVIVVSTSGGKDSQAMAWHVVQIADAAGMLHKVIAVHADLGRIEWEGTRELAGEQARRLGITRFEVVQAKGGDLLDKVRARFRRLKAKAEKEARDRGEDPTTVTVPPAWPSSSARWCTSGEKRAPIWALYTRLATEFHTQQRDRGEKERPVRILNCIGQRAAESTARARLAPVEIDRPASNGQRHITTWRPIHSWSDRQVWAAIADSGLPYHPAYDWGMTRLSCALCVLGCQADSVLAARLLPGLAADYIGTEDYVGATFKNGLSMRQIVARAAELDAAGELVKPPPGTAMAGYLGRRRTAAYLQGLDLAA